MKSRAAKVLLAAIFLLFLSTTVNFGLDIAYLLQEIRTYLMSSIAPLSERYDLFNSQMTVTCIMVHWPLAINVRPHVIFELSLTKCLIVDYIRPHRRMALMGHVPSNRPPKTYSGGRGIH